MQHDADLEFMQWVREAPLEELRAQHGFAVDWQRVAIARELVRRQSILDGNATAAGMNRLLDGENVKDTVKK
jgi:hypothetical protein